MSAEAALPRRGYRGEIAPGCAVRWRGRVHQVVELCGTTVTLLPQEEPDHHSAACADQAPVPQEAGAPPAQYSVVWLDHLVRSPGFEVLGAPHEPRVFAPLGRLESVNPEALRRARKWEPHIEEVHTGVHPHALGGSAPRPQYDPATRTLAQRYQAKAAELEALGWIGASAATVERKRRAWLREGLWGLVDDRRTRVRSELGRADQRVVELLLNLVQRSRKRKESVGNGTRLYERLKAELERRLPLLAQVLLPPLSSFYALLKKLGIKVKDLTAPLRRQGDQDNRPTAPFSATLAQLPGERVEIDTTGLDLLALGENGLPVSLELTAAIDVATRSILGAVVRPKTSGVKQEAAGKGTGGEEDGNRSGHRTKQRRRRGRATKGVDASLLLAQMLTPHKAAPHWSKLARAENSDLPYAQLLESDPRMAGAAARPVITPTMIVIDHGKVFTSQAFLNACAYLGISVRRPASAHPPTRRSSSGPSRRSSRCSASSSPATPARTSPGAARVWRRGGCGGSMRSTTCCRSSCAWCGSSAPTRDCATPFHPAMDALTPNQAYAAHVASTGYLPVPLSDEDVLHLLPSTWARVTDKGIRFNRRTYDGPKLNPYRGAPSGLPGRNRMRWEVRYHPYQPETVWLRDHRSDEWVPVDFIYKDLISDPWTEQVWEQATDDAQARGQRDDEQALAREVSKLLRKAARPPARGTQPPSASWEETVRVSDLDPVDPYANIPTVDPATIAPRRTLDGEPAAAPEAAAPGAEPHPGSEGADQPRAPHRIPQWVRQAVRAAVATRAGSPAAPALSPGRAPDTSAPCTPGAATAWREHT